MNKKMNVEYLELLLIKIDMLNINDWLSVDELNIIIAVVLAFRDNELPIEH